MPSYDPTSAINALRTAIIAIEKELGITPKGVYADVRTRLDILESRIDNLNAPHIGWSDPLFLGNSGVSIIAGYGYPIINSAEGSLYLREDGYDVEGLYSRRNGLWQQIDTTPFIASNDLSGTNQSQTVIGLQNNPISPIAPQDGYSLIWNQANNAWTPKPNYALGIINNPINNITPSDGYSLIWNNNISEWQPEALAVLFDPIGSTSNIISNKYSIQSSIDNTKQNILNLSTNTNPSGPSVGAVANYAIIIGGDQNSIFTDYGFIGNGLLNSTTGFYSSILNGTSNSTNGFYSNILNGSSNSTNGLYSTIINGTSNSLQSDYSSIIGGFNNKIISNLEQLSSIENSSNSSINNCDHSCVLNGDTLTLTTSDFSSLLNGYNLSIINSHYSSIIDGYNCSINTGYFNIIGSGFANIISGDNNSILNGYYNSIIGSYSTILNGDHNEILSNNSIILSGLNNVVTGYGSSIMGDNNNILSSYSILHGSSNNIGADYCFVDGYQNFIDNAADYSFTFGDNNNIYLGANRSATFGDNNHIFSDHSYVFGSNNTIIENSGHSLLIGQYGNIAFTNQYVQSPNQYSQFTRILLNGSSPSGGQFNLIPENTTQNIVLEDNKAYDICLRILIVTYTGTFQCARYIYDILAHQDSGVLVLDNVNLTDFNDNGTGWTTSILCLGNQFIVQIDSNGTFDRRAIATIEWSEISRT